MAATTEAPAAAPAGGARATGDEPIPVVASVEAVYGAGEFGECGCVCVVCYEIGGQETGGGARRQGTAHAFRQLTSSPPPSLSSDAAPAQAAVFDAMKALSLDVFGVAPTVYARSPGERRGERKGGQGAVEVASGARRFRLARARQPPLRSMRRRCRRLSNAANGGKWGKKGNREARFWIETNAHPPTFLAPSAFPFLPQAVSTTSASTSTTKATTCCPPPSCKTRKWRPRAPTTATSNWSTSTARPTPTSPSPPTRARPCRPHTVGAATFWRRTRGCLNTARPKAFRLMCPACASSSTAPSPWGPACRRRPRWCARPRWRCWGWRAWRRRKR